VEHQEVFEYCLRWQRGEFGYRSGKFDSADDVVLLLSEGIGEDTVWWDQIVAKLQRAGTLGLQTAAGRQAAAKCAAAALALVEAAVMVHGPLPEPGVPSGYNVDQLMT
jgi:hypothetical protein